MTDDARGRHEDGSPDDPTYKITFLSPSARAAIAGLDAFGCVDRAVAGRLLDSSARRAELSPEDVKAVLAYYPPSSERSATMPRDTKSKRISTANYEISHGRRPRGRGSWGFENIDTGQEHWHNGNVYGGERIAAAGEVERPPLMPIV
jgi:hypothetical protein